MLPSIQRRRVVVTGIGTINALGHNLEDTWAKIVAQESGIGPITHFDASSHRTQFGGEVKGFDPDSMFGRREARRMDRVSQLALAASDQALQQADFASLPEETRRRTGVIMGTGIGGVGTIEDNVQVYNNRGADRVSPHFIPMMLADTIPARISLMYGLCGPNMSIATACASSTNAIGETARMIAYGEQNVMISGGAEAAMTPAILAGFNRMGAMSTFNEDPQRACRPFDLNRGGFVPAEGAAILVLEEYEHAKARGATILAEIIGYGTTADAFHVTAPHENGVGASESMAMALRNAGIEANEIDYINAHGTSTKLNDRMETIAIKDIFGEDAYNLAISSTKSMHGHLLGGAGALELSISIRAMRENVLPPTINYETPDPELDLDYITSGPRAAEINTIMSNSFGFGGHNATLICRSV